jgi:hypothetical protein
MWAKIVGSGMGNDGKSAYEIWLEQGNTGTEQDFLNSLGGSNVTINKATNPDFSIKAPLTLNDFSGYNEPYHPSVLYFSKGWNGYKYWMAQTPYPMVAPPYRDRWECPVIYRSNDGVSWEVVVNPLDDLTSSEITNEDYFSDPHLVINGGTLECWYRITRGNDLHTYILRKKTTDGVNWSARETIIDCNVYGMVRSQALFIEDGKYKMWYTGKSGNAGDVGYSESVDGLTWGTRTNVTIDKSMTIWHLDCVKLDGKYYLLGYVVGSESLELFESVNGINFTFVKQLLIKGGNTFYTAGLYRSCITRTDDDLRIYFSGDTVQKTAVGLMVGTNFNDLQIANGQKPFRYHDELTKNEQIVNPKTIGKAVTLEDGSNVEGVIKSLLDRITALENGN